MNGKSSEFHRLLAAWGVHLVTASGAVLCLLALRASSEARWQEAFAWLAAAVIIDGVDGGLARWARVKETLPHVDGALLDNLIDYGSYVLVPAYILYRSELLPPDFAFIAAAVVCLASAYQFCQTNAKTEDHFFTGFPSYWNIAAFYLFVMKLSPAANLVVVTILIVLVFVPIRYVYPTRTPRFKNLTIALTVIWTGMLLVMLWQFPSPSPYLVWSSWIFIGYYVTLSLSLMLARRIPSQRDQ